MRETTAYLLDVLKDDKPEPVSSADEGAGNQLDHQPQCGECYFGKLLPVEL